MEDNDEKIKPNKINYIGFNFDCSYFCLGTDIGFEVYQTNPLSLIISKILNGGIGIIKILDKSNIFCLVGGGKNPRFSPNVLIIWNDKNDEISNEFRCDSFIVNCYIKQNCIFIICSLSSVCPLYFSFCFSSLTSFFSLYSRLSSTPPFSFFFFSIAL